MAYSEDSKLIDRIRETAKRLKVAASWVKSGLPVDLASDFIFELFVLLRAVEDLQKSYSVEYVPGLGGKAHQFPRKPSKKAGRPYFKVRSKTKERVLCQICAGTKVRDINATERTPDISFQRESSGDNPTYNDVEMIWDAKYRTDSKERISHPEFSEFARWIEVLELRKAIEPSVSFNGLKDMLANCLVTNGQPSTESDAERKRVNLKEVSSFFLGKQFKVVP